MASVNLSADTVYSLISFIHSFIITKQRNKPCVSEGKGMGDGGGGCLEQWFDIWIEQRNFFPLRILPRETLTCTKSEARQSCPGENDKVTRGIAEIISVKHLDSMQSNDASCSHFQGGEKSISSPGRYLLFKVP